VRLPDIPDDVRIRFLSGNGWHMLWALSEWQLLYDEPWQCELWQPECRWGVLL
jgi:hypothetical protein